MRLLNSIALGMLLITGASQAAVNDALPADYFPPEVGTSTFAIYAFNRQSIGPYKNGQKQIDGTVNTYISVVRISHIVSVAGHPVALMGVLPWSQSSVDPAPLAKALGQDASGLGDVRMGATGWLINNRDSGEYIGITGLVFLPNGAYTANQILNAGENRYKYTLNAGWIHPLNRSFVLEVLPEVAWYGDNTNYLGGRTLSQKPTYALTSYLRYRATPSWQFHLGAQINQGGETRINGVDQSNPPDNNRLMLGTTYLTDDKKGQWILRIAKDTEVKNGFATESEIMLRYLTAF